MPRRRRWRSKPRFGIGTNGSPAADIPDGPWRQMLERSALTLKGLVFEPTGSPIAAATTSLPETPGGSRNWDYRYTWLRDGVFTLAALQDLGFREEARRFIDFVCGRLVGGHQLQVMYGIGGERELPESTLDHLAGYEGARPVRIGNGAVGQRQHDVWGVLLHLVERDVAAGGSIAADRWPLLVAQVEAAMRHWREPDRGIWEVRGEPRHFTSSKLMAWVALDRGARLAAGVGDERQRRALGGGGGHRPRRHLRARPGRARRLHAGLRRARPGCLDPADARDGLPAGDR